MSRRRKTRRVPEDVQLNLAAMLDMAFQLLAFFILTFRPSPVEGQLLLNLPPPTPVTSSAANGGEGEAVRTSDVEPVILSVFGDGSGNIAEVRLFSGESGFRGPATPENLQRLSKMLEETIHAPGSLYDEVLVQVDPSLRYEELMKVIDVCLRQQLPDGQPLTKINFTELTPSEGQ